MKSQFDNQGRKILTAEGKKGEKIYSTLNPLANPDDIPTLNKEECQKITNGQLLALQKQPSNQENIPDLSDKKDDNDNIEEILNLKSFILNHKSAKPENTLPDITKTEKFNTFDTNDTPLDPTIKKIIEELNAPLWKQMINSFARKLSRYFAKKVKLEQNNDNYAPTIPKSSQPSYVNRLLQK
ncbi:MAG: hypothetical protein WC570_01840 [Patescibacteria group bacterium]